MKKEQNLHELNKQISNISVDSSIPSNKPECPYCYSSGLQIEFKEYYYNGTKKRI